MIEELVMKALTKGPHVPPRVQISYQLLRNTTSPDEKSSGVQSFVANLPADEILKLDTKENLRGYIAEYNPRKRNRVHDAIRNTILTEPERFIVRNSGFVITASAIEVDDNQKKVTLDDPSIINGAQSQGEIKRYLDEITDPDNPEPPAEAPFHVRAEFIIDSDAAEVVETAIARNTATPVKNISQAGARGHLDELQASIAKVIPGAKIRQSETEENVLDTRRILQLARLLMPTSVSGNTSASEKLRAYKNPEQCLTDFSDWFENKKFDPSKKAKYDFSVEIAPYAILEYDRWEKHDAWNKHHLWEETKKGGRAVRRDKNGKIIWISPGLLFPLMGAISEFTKQEKNGRWVIAKPSHFKEEELVRRAVNQFRAHNSDPMAMGRSEAAYDALRIYPQTLIEVMREMKRG
jgi:hypothetical protein